MEVRKQYQIKISNRFSAVENLNVSKDINRVWENIKQIIKTSAKESLGLYELKQHKPWFNEECSRFLDQRKQAKMQWLHISPAVDQIPAELVKAGGRTICSEIHKLLILFGIRRCCLEVWKESIIVPIYKKGDKTNCSSYRGISLLSSTYKILIQHPTVRGNYWGSSLWIPFRYVITLYIFQMQI